MRSEIEELRLVPHPATTSDIVRRIDVRIRWTETAHLTIRYALEGDRARIRIPPPRAPGRTDGLWRHTCFEIFILKPDGKGYIEFNFSPSGEWATYDFKSYREPAPLLEVAAPEIIVGRKQAALEVEATLELPPLLDGTAPLNAALAAVVEDQTGALSYWALRHPEGQPDFHDRGNFLVELQPPGVDAAEPSSVNK